jgi:UDPglucose 6-dehydrogenase
MKIAIIGSGYVGLVTGACFAQVGHEVICVDNDQRKVKALNNGRLPIYEPGLEQLVLHNVAARRLQFTGAVEHGVDNSEVIFIAVPTPPRADGSVDLTYIEQVAREIASGLKEYRVIVDKSTVPVNTGEKVTDTIRRYNKTNVDFDVVSNPEFLRDGMARVQRSGPHRGTSGDAYANGFRRKESIRSGRNARSRFPILRNRASFG